MNKKIKEISIRAFRAYKDIQKFDFTHKTSGKVANLVAIYAPNGYGKTSFFDAIEWAVTGTIERLNTGKPIQEEVKKEEGYVLKNKDSCEEYGNVTIISENDEIFSVNTKKKTGRMKSDFRSGETEKISPGLNTIFEEKDSFCTTNLLAHDKITGFLQNYTAGDKTNELRVMWDKNNYSDILHNISELYKELECRRKQLSLELSKEERELNNYKYENDQSNKILSLLLNYEKKYDKHFLMSTSFEIESMLSLFHEFHEDSQGEREGKENAYNTSEVLLKDYTTFINNQNKMFLLKKEKQVCDESINMWEKFELTKSKHEKLNREIKQLSELLGKVEQFYSFVEKNKFNINELRKIENHKIKYQKEQVGVDEILHGLDEKIKDINLKLENLETKKEQLKENYSEFTNNQLEINRYKRLNSKAKYVLEERNKRMREWYSYVEQINLFFEGKLGIGLLYNVVSDDTILKCNLIIKLQKEQKLLIENTEALEGSRKKLVNLYDTIQQLCIKGSNIVREQKMQECPLCHMEYEDTEKLLGRIDAATIENIELEKIEEQIRKNKIRHVEIDNELKQLKEEVENEVMTICNVYEKKYMHESEKVKKLQIIVETWGEKVDIANNICKKIKEKYLQEGLDISMYEQILIKEEEIQEHKNIIKKEIEQVENDLKKAKKGKKELGEKVISCDLKTLEIKAENNKINTDPLYIEVKQLLEEKEFYNQRYDYNKMKSLIETENNQLKNKKSIIDNELQNFHLKDMRPKDEYVMKLKECQKEINKLQVDISDYLLRCEKMLGQVDEKELLKQINQINKNLEKDIKVVSERIQSETSILLGLRTLKEQEMWMNNKQKVENKKMNLMHLEKRIEKLQECKNCVEDYIVDKTNEYFNSDIINQIYNKIDPHPTMKHIKFITQKDNEGLKTRIYTYDESEENKMSPVVYLSSAQVNILSLCIFLSKVLSEKNTTFNTIFIDDPIQHLDGINLLSFIDVLRTITSELGRQIIISTHNEQFYKLLRVKMHEDYYSSKFIELASAGRVEN